MADDFSAVNKTLKETTDFLKKKSAQDAAESAKTRAVLEKTAASTGKSLEDIKDRASAKLQIKKQDEAAKVAFDQKSATMKLLGISQKRMDKANELSIQIQAQEKIMAEQKASLEESGVDADKTVGYQKQQIKLDKLKAKKDNATGAAASEDDAKAAAGDKKSNSILGKIAGGIGGLVKKGKDATKSGLPSWKTLVMGGLAAAALVFLNHPKFKEFIDVIKKKIIPALTTLIDDYIIPIGKILWDNIVKQFGFLMTLFDGIGESIELFKEGKWWEGIKKLFSSIGGWLADAIDSAATALFNIIATIFGLEKTDSVFGSISKFFTDMYDKVVNFISDLITSVKEFFVDNYNKFIEFVTGLNMFKGIKKTIDDIIDAVKGIFSGEDIMGNLKKLAGGFLDIVMTPYNLAINFLKDIFKFGDPNKPFRMSVFIGEIFDDIVNWFKGLLNIDFKKIAKEIVPDWAPDFIKSAMGIGDDGKKTDPIDRQVEIQKQLKEQRKQVFSGDTHEGLDSDRFNKSGNRLAIIKKLEAELADEKRKTQQSSGSGGVTNIANNTVNGESKTAMVPGPVVMKNTGMSAAVANSK